MLTLGTDRPGLMVAVMDIAGDDEKVVRVLGFNTELGLANYSVINIRSIYALQNPPVSRMIWWSRVVLQVYQPSSQPSFWVSLSPLVGSTLTGFSLFAFSKSCPLRRTGACLLERQFVVSHQGLSTPVCYLRLQTPHGSDFFILFIKRLTNLDFYFSVRWLFLFLPNSRSQR